MFEINKVYNFDTLAASLLGSSIRQAKCVSIMDHETASKENNIDLQYRNIYPLLPNGTVDDSKAQTYYKFKTVAGLTIILCEQWINASTIVLVTATGYRVIIQDASTQDIATLRDVINSMGITDYVIETL